MKTTLLDLSPLIQASDLWRKDSSKELWIGNNQGKLFLSETQPNNLFCNVLTCQDLTGVTEGETPSCYVEWPSGKHTLVLPESWEELAPFEGRPYKLGKWDCYSLVKDYMKQTYSIDMEWLTASWKELSNNYLEESIFSSNEELKNWEKVAVPQVGDGILFSMSRKEDYTNPNHCGVYIAGDRLLHHYSNRLSCIEPFSENWKNRVVTYMRYKT